MRQGMSEEKSIMDRMVETLQPVLGIWKEGKAAKVTMIDKVIRVEATTADRPYFEYRYFEFIGREESFREETIYLELPPPKVWIDEIVEKLVSTIHAVSDEPGSVVFHVTWYFDQIYARKVEDAVRIDYHYKSGGEMFKDHYCIVKCFIYY